MSASDTRKIAYEPHPLSAERKAELVALGFRIVDVIYRPKEQMPFLIKKQVKKKKTN